MRPRIVLLLVFFLLWANVSTLFAQTNPTVEIVLDRRTAQQGERVNADIYIRNGVNIGGADIGITVDEQCLRIADRQVGAYIPSSGEAGGFSPFSELNEHDTRFAAAITDRTKVGNGDGVFYRVALDVTCEEGIAPLTVVFGQIAGYADPNAESVELVRYEMETGNVNVINTQLVIGAAEQAQATATAIAPTATPTPEAAPITAQPADNTNTLLIAALSLVCVSSFGLLILFLLWRRRSRKDEDQRAKRSRRRS